MACFTTSAMAPQGQSMHAAPKTGFLSLMPVVGAGAAVCATATHPATNRTAIRQARITRDLDIVIVSLLLHVALFFVVARRARVQGNTEVLPNRVDVIGKVQMAPLKQVLVF